MKIGVIAEDKSDIQVLEEITAKLVNTKLFSFRPFVGSCGILRRKCAAWADNLLKRGCKNLIVVHDLDNNDVTKLYQELNYSVKDTGFNAYVILIPIREIESWLLADPEAIRRTFNLKKIPKVSNKPETLQRPKEELRDIVWRYGRIRYINTIHNRQIARFLSIPNLNCCGSFAPYPVFLKNIFRRRIKANN